MSWSNRRRDVNVSTYFWRNILWKLETRDTSIHVSGMPCRSRVLDTRRPPRVGLHSRTKQHRLDSAPRDLLCSNISSIHMFRTPHCLATTLFRWKIPVMLVSFHACIFWKRSCPPESLPLKMFQRSTYQINTFPKQNHFVWVQRFDGNVVTQFIQHDLLTSQRILVPRYRAVFLEISSSRIVSSRESELSSLRNLRKSLVHSIQHISYAFFQSLCGTVRGAEPSYSSSDLSSLWTRDSRTGWSYDQGSGINRAIVWRDKGNCDFIWWWWRM